MGNDEFRYQIINELPYPLGLLFRNLCQSYLLYEETQQQEAFRRDLFSFGYGFSHFLSLLNLKQYLAEDPLSSPNLNKQILQTFRSKPAIRWQILLTQNLTKLGFRPFIQELKDILQKTVPMNLIAPFQEDETLHEDCISILSYFFEIPASLSSQKIQAYFQLAEFLLKEYSFLKEYYLVVPQEDLFWLCQGTQPKLTRMKTALHFDRHWDGHLFLVSKMQSYLNLHPFIVLKQHEDYPELHFLHQEIASRVHYIGHGLKSLYLDNELAPGILSHYQKVVVSLRNFSLTSRVLRPYKSSDLQQKNFIYFHLSQFHESHRQPELTALKKFLQDESSGYGVIYGPAGIGKTALLCKIYEEKHKNHFWYFFHPLTEIQNTPEGFYQMILLQMKTAFSLTFTIPNNLKELNLLFWDISNQCAQLLKKEEKKLVIWLDGVNDAGKDGTECLLDYLPKKLPENVLFLFTLQTRENHFLNALSFFYLETRIRPVPLLSPMRGLDFQAFSDLLQPYHAQLLFKKETLQHLFRLLKNQEERISPLYLNLLLRCLQVSKDKMLQPYVFPKDEQDCFLFLWNRFPSSEQERVVRYLAILSLIQEKGTDDLFCRLFHKSHEYISEISGWLAPFLIQDEDGYQIFHPRIKELIQEQFQPAELAQFHFQLAQFYDKPEEQAWFQVENASTFYSLTYHYYHYFQVSRDSKRYLEIIEDLTYSREKERRIRGFQPILDELKLSIQLFSSENRFAKLIHYGFKYNNTKNYREKGLMEIPQLLQQEHYGELLQIFKGLDSFQSKRLGILYIAYVCGEQQRLEKESALKELISFSSMGFVLELRHFYLPMVKKLVSLNIPELLHFNRNLSQIHLRTLNLLPEDRVEISSKNFYHHIHLLLQGSSKDIEDVPLYESLLCLMVTSQADESLDLYFQETKKRLKFYGKYTPSDLAPFLIRLGSIFYKRGFRSELETIKNWVEIHFPLQDSELQENPDWEELAQTREEIRKSLTLEICRQKAFPWLGEDYCFQVTAIPSLSSLNLLEVEDLLEAIATVEDFSIQAYLIRQLLEALESYITHSHDFKVKFLEQIYQKCFQDKHPSVEFLVRMCKIYQESARNVQSRYTYPLLLELCKQLKYRSQTITLEKIIHEERQRIEPQSNLFLYELNQFLSPNSSAFESIPLLDWNEAVLNWFLNESHYENLEFERFPELLCLLKQEDFLNVDRVEQVSLILKKMFRHPEINQKISFEYLPLFQWISQIIRALFACPFFDEGELLLQSLMEKLCRIESLQYQRKAIEYLMNGLKSFEDGNDKALRMIQRLFGYTTKLEYSKNQEFFLANLFFLCTQIQNSELRNTLLMDAREAIATHPFPESRYKIFTWLTSAKIGTALQTQCFISSLIEREKIKQLRTRYYYLLGLAHQLLKVGHLQNAIDIFVKVQEDVYKLPASEKKCRLLTELASGFYECLQYDLLESTLEEYYRCTFQLEDKKMGIDLLFKAIYQIASFQKHPQLEALFNRTIRIIRDSIQNKTCCEQAVILATLGKILVRFDQKKQGQETIFEAFPLLQKVDLKTDKEGEDQIASALEKIIYEVNSTRSPELIERVVHLLSEKYHEEFFFRHAGYSQEYRALVFTSFGESYFHLQQHDKSQKFINMAMSNLREIESFDFVGETYILICKKLLSMGMETSNHYEKALTKAISFIKKTPDENVRYQRIEAFARILKGMDDHALAMKRLNNLTPIASNFYDQELREKALAILARILCQLGSLEMAEDLLKSDNAAKAVFLPDYVLALAKKEPQRAIDQLKYLPHSNEKWELIRQLATQFDEKKEIDSLKQLTILAIEDHETIDFIFYKLLHVLDNKEIIEQLKNQYLAE